MSSQFEYGSNAISGWRDNGRKPSVTDRGTDARMHGCTLIQVNIRTEGQGINILPRSGAEAGLKNLHTDTV